VLSQELIERKLSLFGFFSFSISPITIVLFLFIWFKYFSIYETGGVKNYFKNPVFFNFFSNFQMFLFFLKKKKKCGAKFSP
jgi:hypothetical protein